MLRYTGSVPLWSHTRQPPVSRAQAHYGMSWVASGAGVWPRRLAGALRQLLRAVGIGREPRELSGGVQ